MRPLLWFTKFEQQGKLNRKQFWRNRWWGWRTKLKILGLTCPLSEEKKRSLLHSCRNYRV